jgi:hypothetical protein
MLGLTLRLAGNINVKRIVKISTNLRKYNVFETT